MMTARRAVLSVASLSTPSRPLLKHEYHALMPLGRKTILQLLLDELVAAGATSICFLAGHGSEAVREFVQTWREGGFRACADDFGAPAPPRMVDVHWVSHEPTTDYGDALLEARAFVGDEPFILSTTEAPMCHVGTSDLLLGRMTKTMEVTGADGVVAVQDISRLDVSTRTVVEPLGNPGAVPHFVVGSVRHQPFPQDDGGRAGLMNRYVLSPLIFDYLEEQGAQGPGGPRLTAALNRMARDREALWAVRMQSGELCLDLSSFLLYSRAFIQFSLQDPEVGIALQDYVRSLVAQ